MTWFERRIENFIKRVIQKAKKIPIGPNKDDPTYWRWFVIPRNHWFNVYLHNFRHDDEEHLHDHRMMNISFLLQGRYCEERFVRTPEAGLPLPETVKRSMPRLIMRLPATPHRVVLDRDLFGHEMPCWSLFIDFPHVRAWGFWCPGRDYKCRWVPFQQYVTNPNPTAVGYGQAGNACDE